MEWFIRGNERINDSNRPKHLIINKSGSGVSMLASGSSPCTVLFTRWTFIGKEEGRGSLVRAALMRGHVLLNSRASKARRKSVTAVEIQGNVFILLQRIQEQTSILRDDMRWWSLCGCKSKISLLWAQVWVFLWLTYPTSRFFHSNTNNFSELPAGLWWWVTRTPGTHACRLVSSQLNRNKKNLWHAHHQHNYSI